MHTLLLPGLNGTEGLFLTLLENTPDAYDMPFLLQSAPELAWVAISDFMKNVQNEM